MPASHATDLLVDLWSFNFPFRTLLDLTQRANPDVAIACRVVMILQPDWSLWVMNHQFWERAVPGGSQKLGVILCDHSIVEDGDIAGHFHFSVLEAWAGIDDIVDLPFARRARSIHQRRGLTVDG